MKLNARALCVAAAMAAGGLALGAHAVSGRAASGPVRAATVTARAAGAAPAVPESTAWSRDVGQTVRAAMAARTDTLIWFSGSGWNEASDAAEPALRDPAFVADASPSFALVRADFPKADGGVGTGAVDPQYTAWAERLDVRRLPALVAVDEVGRPYAAAYDLPRTAAACAETVRGLQRVRAARDDAFARAARLSGTDKARALHAGLAAVAPFAKTWYQPAVKDLLAADPADAAGLSGHYQAVAAEAAIDAVVQDEIYPMLDRSQFAEAIARLDRLLRESSPSTEQRQLLVSFKAQVAYSQGRTQQAERWLDEAIALAPASPAAERVRKAKGQIVQTN